MMADAGQASSSGSKDAKEPLTSVNMEEDMKAFRGKHYFRLVVSTAGFVVLAWIFGRIGFSVIWLAPVPLFIFSWWDPTSSLTFEAAPRVADIQARRERAFKNAETAEWLNFILNRW
jgi:Ca2+-dependent lipid-binding protein